jgi:CRP-like cAMP-binding protein
METLQENVFHQEFTGFHSNEPAADLGLSAGFGPGVLQSLKSREHLFWEGDQRKACLEVVSGAVAIYRVQSDGRRQISRFALPGDHIGLGWEAIEPSSAVATCATSVLRRPIAAVRRAALASPALAHGLGVLQAEELRDMNDLICVIALGDAQGRVAAFLLNLARRIGLGGNPIIVDLPMTRSDIADHLGLTLETVSRELSRLRRLRIIEIHRITKLSIVDARGLALLACRP